MPSKLTSLRRATSACGAAWWRTAILLAAACPPLFAQDRPDTRIAELVLEATRKLTACGYQVPEAVRPVERSHEEAIADIDAQQDLLLGKHAFALQHALLHGLGIDVGTEAQDLRQRTIAGMARGLAAYYDPRSRSFALLASDGRAAAEDLPDGLLALVTHELVHACQDAREGGLAGFFGGEGLTLDTALARRCVIEGEADIAAIVALRGADAVQPEAMRAANTLEQLFSGEMTSRIYGAGRLFSAQCLRTGGLPALREAWAKPPSSTEQVLHADKLGKDLPTRVVVPDLPGCQRELDTTVGELLTYHVLRQIGNDAERAGLAATGWDGDQLAVFGQGEAHAQVVVWRSVWDRDEDAADFATALGTAHRGLVVQTGRVVDWIAAPAASLDAIARQCAKDRTAPAENPDDAESTAAAEASLRAELPHSEASQGHWEHAKFGLSIPIPAGWELREVNGLQILLDGESAKSGFAINVNVQQVPSGGMTDLTKVLELNRQQFEQIPSLKLDRLEAGKCGKQDVLHGEYHGKLGKSPALHFLMLLYLRGDQQVVVTATATETQWPEAEATLRQLMQGVRITPP